jgi:hypothetical protein
VVAAALGGEQLVSEWGVERLIYDLLGLASSLPKIFLGSARAVAFEREATTGVGVGGMETVAADAMTGKRMDIIVVGGHSAPWTLPGVLSSSVSGTSSRVSPGMVHVF